jgi:RHS repeat-associated protein
MFSKFAQWVAGALAGFAALKKPCVWFGVGRKTKSNSFRFFGLRARFECFSGSANSLRLAFWILFILLANGPVIAKQVIGKPTVSFKFWYQFGKDTFNSVGEAVSAYNSWQSQLFSQCQSNSPPGSTQPCNRVTISNPMRHHSAGTYNGVPGLFDFSPLAEIWFPPPYSHASYTTNQTGYPLLNTQFTCPTNSHLESTEIPFGSKNFLLNCVDYSLPDLPANIDPEICPRPDGSSTGKPIIPSTGEKHLYETDHADSASHPLNISRTYRAYGRTNAPAAQNAWRFGFGASLNIIPSAPLNEAYVELGDGRVRKFTKSEASPSWGDVNFRDTLSQQPDGSWLYINADDEGRWQFNTSQRLQTHTQRNGWVTTYTYNAAGLLDRVTNHFGRYLQMGYNASNQLSQITVPGGNIIRYEYDASSRLSRVLHPDNTSKTYHYENASFPQALTGVTDERGTRLATYSYDAQGRAIETVHAGGANRYAVTYPASTGAATQVTDPLGTTRSYQYATNRGQLAVTSGSQPSGAGLRDAASRVQNAAGLVDSETDFLGINTLFNWDTTRRLPLSTTKAAGTAQAQTVQTEWHPTFRLPTRVTEAGRVTVYTYDALGNKLSEAVTDAASNITRTWRWTYNAQGLVATATAPNNGVTSYTYNSAGLPVSSTNPLGHSTTYTYGTTGGAEGRVTKMVPPNGAETNYTYDLRGRVTSMAGRSVGGASLTTTFAYIASGQLGTLTLPSGHQISYSYDDAQRLRAWADNRGARGTYTLDAMGNRTREEVRDTLGNLVWEQSRSINALNRVASETQGTNLASSTYGYNANGDLINESTAGKTTAFGLDPIRRVQSMINAANATANLQYNARNDVTGASDFKGIATTYNRDALGNATQEATPDAGTRSTEYDALGLPSRMVSALGQAAQITRDAAGRPTLVTWADGTTSQLRYDLTGTTYNSNGVHGSKGLLSEMVEPHVTTRYRRDPLGRINISTTILGNGSTRNTYFTHVPSGPGAGEMGTVTYANGNVLSHQFNAAGQVSGLLWNNVPVLANISYNALGMPTSWSLPWSTNTASLTPITVQRSYDSAGRLSATNFASYSYDTSGNVSAITEQVWRPSTLASGTGMATSTVAWSVNYDALNRLTQFQANSATPASLLAPSLGAQRTVFGFDANGSRNTESRYTTSGSPTAVLSVLTRTPMLEGSSNRLLGFNQSVAVGTQTASTALPYSLNAAGDLTQSGLLRYFYNARGRLSSVTAGSDDLSPTTRYAYNLLGQRVFKTQALIPPAPGDESDPVFFQSLLSFFAQSWNPTASNPQAAQESIGTLYLYGHEGYLGESTLLGEYSNTTGSPSAQHIYLQTPQGPLPVVTILNGTRYAVMADHLHTPRRLQQTNLITNWQWAYSAFGEEPPTQRKYRFANNSAFPNLGETTTANPLNFNLRYPGQVADAESNLFYNHHRTYDPRQGRYTQSDPIGLQGGWNRFAYVDSNPLVYIDPEGLQSYPPPRGTYYPRGTLPRPVPLPRPENSSQAAGYFNPDGSWTCLQWNCPTNSNSCGRNDQRSSSDFLPPATDPMNPPSGCTCTGAPSWTRDMGIPRPFGPGVVDAARDLADLYNTLRPALRPR